MDRDIRLIGLDLDNTMLNEKKEMTPRVAAAVREAIRRGIVVLPATGRGLTGIPKDILAIPGMRYALTSNGAMVHDLADGSVLYSNCFEKGVALSLLEECKRLGIIPAVFLNGEVYTETLNYDELAKHFSQGIIEYFKKSRMQVPDILQTVRESTAPVEKISIVYPDVSVRPRSIEVFEARGDCAITASLGENLELNSRTANKGAALLELGRQLGYSRPQVMAIGDSYNDLEMLKAVGYSVAMGNADPEVLQAADAVTLTAEEDGVALAIEQVMGT